MNTYTHPMDAKGPTYVGSKLVYPGETVAVEGEASTPVVESAAAAVVTLEELVKKPIKDIKAAMPELLTPALEELILLEKAAAKPRDSLIAELDAEVLKRRTAGE